MQEGYITTTTTAYGEENSEHTEVVVREFPPNVVPARVRLTSSLTKNLGNYNSARVEVSIELPCLPTEADVANAASTIESWVTEILDEKVNRISLSE